MGGEGFRGGLGEPSEASEVEISSVLGECLGGVDGEPH